MRESLYNSGDYKRVVSLPEKISSAEENAYRTDFRKDYGRLLHSPSFRRLQGKTQLFPWAETDFFRNRLTHSLEVAQIAKMIAVKLNKTVPFFMRKGFQIDTDLVEFAGLAHDLGHPPFGHTGEKVLDNLMKKHGGFEGNAQTLRLLTKVEKRQFNGAPIDNKGKDCRCGLNLTYRTLASILKYNREIPGTRDIGNSLVKGYYNSEADLVTNIIKSVTGTIGFSGEFKSIECQIMDIADDIAYSTYDLEDAFKAKFITPLDCLSISNELANQIGEKVFSHLKPQTANEKVKQILYKIFTRACFPASDETEYDMLNEICKRNEDGHYNISEIESFFLKMISLAYKTSIDLVENGYIRSHFTSELVGLFISGVEVKPNDEIPALSKVYLKNETREQVEVLKHFTFNSLTLTPRLNIVSKRGFEIVEKIFEALNEPEGSGLLPEDYRNLYMKINENEKHRMICDFIAGMTDRYAIEFYGRLTSENPETIFKPF